VLVLVVASAAQFLTILDLWVVNIAFPTLQRDFAPATLSSVSWILNVYAIVLAAVLVPAGRVADSFDRRTCFLGGLLLFGAASLGCALAGALPVLIGFRALQGIGAAVMMPTSLGFALTAFPADKRGMAVGVWAAVGGAAAGSGPVVGGLLLSLSWRWIFTINLPIVLATAVGGAFWLPSSRTSRTRRIDGVGALLVLAAMGLICTGLVEADAWPALRAWTAIVLGALLAAAFVAHAAHHPDPVIAPRLFATPRFRVGAAGIFTYYLGFGAMLPSLTLLLTERWHLSALHAALDIAPGPIIAGIILPLAGWLTGHIGLRHLVVPGALIFAAAAAWPLVTVGADPDYVFGVLPILLLWAFANAFIQPTLFATADAAPSADLASASAVLTMARQLASALGVAVLVAVLGTQHTTGLAGLRHAWMMVIGAAALTALVGLYGDRPAPSRTTREVVNITVKPLRIGTDA
jgi:EmrB/QacA subfamily drug resistance transporter